MERIAAIVLGIALISIALPASATPPLMAADAGESSWEYGEITAGPASGETGWATNPHGDHDPDECGALVSTPLPGALLGDAELSFTHAYDIMWSSSSESAFDAGTVILSLDGGQTWQAVHDAEYPSDDWYSAVDACLDEYGVDGSGVYAGSADLHTVNVDLSEAVSDTDLVQVGFLFASSSVVEYNGWSITEASLGDVSLTLDVL